MERKGDLHFCLYKNPNDKLTDVMSTIPRNGV